jgi:hypothetical protein
VDRERALDELPALYAVALRLEAQGSDTALIARAVGIEPEAVTSFLAIAHAKLSGLLDGDA